MITAHIMTRPTLWYGILRFQRLGAFWRATCSTSGIEVTQDIPDAQLHSTVLQAGLKDGPLSAYAHLFGETMALLNAEEREQDTHNKVEQIHPGEYHVRLTSP